MDSSRQVIERLTADNRNLKDAYDAMARDLMVRTRQVRELQAELERVKRELAVATAAGRSLNIIQG